MSELGIFYPTIPEEYEIDKGENYGVGMGNYTSPEGKLWNSFRVDEQMLITQITGTIENPLGTKKVK